jgi:hypothetical protein
VNRNLRLAYLTIAATATIVGAVTEFTTGSTALGCFWASMTVLWIVLLVRTLRTPNGGAA